VSKKLKIIIGIVILFLIYMAFFDQNNWILQYKRQKALEATESHIDFLKQESAKMEQELNGLANSPETIERNAREKYYHKKDNEDVYILKDTSQQILEKIN